MTDPARPQPVLDAAKLGGYVQAAITAVGGVVVIFYPAVTGAQVSRLSVAVGLAVTALVSFGVYLGAVLHGKVAAAQVTPLADPQDNRGRALVPVDEYGRHAAAPAALPFAVVEHLDEPDPADPAHAALHGSQMGEAAATPTTPV